MAKRKTIKNNPLDSLSNDSTQDPQPEFENLLMGTDLPSRRVTAKTPRKANPVVAKDSNRKSQTVPMETLVEDDEAPKENPKPEPSASPKAKKPTVEVSPENLAQRISRLEEENRMQNILIAIIMVPLAVLALLGAVAIP